MMVTTIMIGKPTREEIKKKIEKNKELYATVIFIFVTTLLISQFFNISPMMKNIRYEISEEEWSTIELPKPEDVCINFEFIRFPM